MSRRLYDAVWNIPTLDSTEKLILLCLADHAKDDGYAFPSQEVLSARCSCHTKTIGRVTAKLEKLKWLSRWMDGSRHYQYQLNCEKIAQFNPSIPDSKSSHTGPEVSLLPDTKSSHTGPEVQLNRTQSPVIPDSKSPQSVINLSNNQSLNREACDGISLDEVRELCAGVGMTEEMLQRFYFKNDQNAWKFVHSRGKIASAASGFKLDQQEYKKKNGAPGGDSNAQEREFNLPPNYGKPNPGGGLGGEVYA
jgi:hypothetical protein